MGGLMSANKQGRNQSELKSGITFRHTKRGRNLAVLLAVLGFSGLFYLITIIRMF
jgi:hypothetical protein